MAPDEIRAARKALGLTGKQIAPLLGYGSVARVSEIERGKRDPGASVVRLLRAYLDGYRPRDWPEMAIQGAPFHQFMALAFPWLNPLGSDYRNMQAAWDAGYKAGKEAKD